MRRLIFILALCANTFCLAQNNAMQEIRELYALANQRVKDMKEERNSMEGMTVTKHSIVPAIGNVEETIEYYVNSSEFVDITEKLTFTPFFIRTKVDARPTVMGLTCEEYLFYESGQLAFYFKKSESWLLEQDVEIEDRIYFDKKGKCINKSTKVISKSTKQPLDPGDEYLFEVNDAKKSADTLCKGFDYLMNK